MKIKEKSGQKIITETNCQFEVSGLLYSLYTPEAAINVKSNLAAALSSGVGPACQLRCRGVSGSVRLAEAELAVFVEMFCQQSGRACQEPPSFS